MLLADLEQADNTAPAVVTPGVFHQVNTVLLAQLDSLTRRDHFPESLGLARRAGFLFVVGAVREGLVNLTLLEASPILSMTKASLWRWFQSS